MDFWAPPSIRWCRVGKSAFSLTWMTEMIRRYLINTPQPWGMRSFTTSAQFRAEKKWIDGWDSGQEYSAVDKDLLLNRQLGMGIMFYDFIDGHIVGGEENKLNLIFYKSTKYPMPDGSRQIAKPRYLRFKIGDSQCARDYEMTEFFDQFTSNQRPLTRRCLHGLPKICFFII